MNCKIELELSCLKDCLISEILNTPEIDANPGAVPPIAHAPVTSTTSELFQTNSTKCYFLIVNLSINDNIEF